MATTNSPLFAGVSGKLKELVIKQYPGKTVITTVPDMSRRKLSAKQKEANERMQLAIYAAKGIVANPRLKQRACERLQVPPNKVFRAIVKQYLLTGGEGTVFEKSGQEIQDEYTLATLKTTIMTDIPGAELALFGPRATGAFHPQSDWDILILSANAYPVSMKWELQEKLFAVTMPRGTCVNILLAQKDKWLTEPEYELLRKRVEENLMPLT